MLKRETFVNAIRALRKQEELMEQMNQIYRQMTDGIGHLEMDGLAQNALLQTLKDLLVIDITNDCFSANISLMCLYGVSINIVADYGSPTRPNKAKR